MKLLHSIKDTVEEVKQARSEGKKIGFVPTMGALHEGHMTLVRRAKEQCDYTVVSIFVNPTQFGPSEDFSKYPRTLESDADICREAGVDLIFAPSAEEMYPQGFKTWVDVGGVTEVLEGAFRPGHFRGVATVCTKLFNIIEPDLAFFGKKDYQQLQVICRLVRDLNMRLDIVPVDTVREPDGLAMSSRNRYLNPEERRAALVLSQSLDGARKLFGQGERNPQVIREFVERIIKSEPRAEIDYVEVVDAETLLSVESKDRPIVVLLAVKVGNTRLIDNTVLSSVQ